MRKKEKIIISVKNYTDEEQEQILKDFVSKISNNQTDIPEDMQLTSEEYWNLLY